MTNSIRIRYFAILREQAGMERETVASSGETLAAIYGRLSLRHRFTLPPDRIRVAVNDTFRSMDHVPEADDEIVFIPPVAGG
jgi:sulfur-carrier protein